MLQDRGHLFGNWSYPITVSWPITALTATAPGAPAIPRRVDSWKLKYFLKKILRTHGIRWYCSLQMLFACLYTRLCFRHVRPDCNAWTCFASKKDTYIPFSVSEREDSFSPLHRKFCCSYSTSPTQPRRHPRLRFILLNNIEKGFDKHHVFCPI